MKIAITGGTGFVGRHIARLLTAQGHEVAIVRSVKRAQNISLQSPDIRTDRASFSIPTGLNQSAQGCEARATLGAPAGISYPEGVESPFLPGTSTRLNNKPQPTNPFPIGLDHVESLAHAFTGCDAVAHCAGINREIGAQTYQRVHIDGTRHVVEAARRAGVRKIILISFLRARPNCGSAYHESKFAAEEIVRQSGLDYTVFKCGVIYGRGDHMLDHLSHAFHTFPVFAFVGFVDKPIRPNAVEDVARLAAAALVDGALSRQTVAVVGPETLTLRQAVLRVAHVAGKRPLTFPMPLWFHYALGWFVEKIMTTPLISLAQVRILSEGLAEPLPRCDFPPPELAPRIPFTETQIRAGLPPAGPFHMRDLRCCHHPVSPDLVQNMSNL